MTRSANQRPAPARFRTRRSNKNRPSSSAFAAQEQRRQQRRVRSIGGLQQQLPPALHTLPRGNDREHAAEEDGGRGETHGPGVLLLHDRPPRTRRGAGCGRGGDGAGRVLHLPDRDWEAEEGRVR